MLCLRRRFHPAWTRFVAGAALAWTGSVALASASQAAAVTFNYTGADASYTIDPGTYRITVYGAQGGNAADCAPANCEGGRGVQASAIYRIGQTLDLRIGVGGTAPANAIAAGGGGQALSISKSAILVWMSYSRLAAAVGTVSTTPDSAPPEATVKQRRPIRRIVGRPKAAAADFLRMVSHMWWPAMAVTAARAFRVAGRLVNRNRQVDLGAAVGAPPASTRVSSAAGVAAGIMAETRATWILLRASQPSLCRKAALHW
jgi:hypothetical protein